MYHLILLTFITGNGMLEMKQTRIDTFYTANECEKFKVVVEKNALDKLKQDAMVEFVCRREV
jgi:hypothetical protein